MVSDMKCFKEKNHNDSDGFITMIILMLVIMSVVIFLAYKRVMNS